MSTSKSKKKTKLAEGFALPATPVRAAVPEAAARAFEQKGEPAPAVPEKKVRVKIATQAINVRMHPDTYKAINDFAYDERLTQKAVMLNGIRALGIKVAPSDLDSDEMRPASRGKPS